MECRSERFVIEWIVIGVRLGLKSQYCRSWRGLGRQVMFGLDQLVSECLKGLVCIGLASQGGMFRGGMECRNGVVSLGSNSHIVVFDRFGS